jgi:uncharacterized repeat protein (TIGR03806 family)
VAVTAAAGGCSEQGDGLTVRPSNLTCRAPARPDVNASVRLVPVYPNLTFDRPVLALQAPNDGSRWYVVEQAGRVRRAAAEASTATASVVVDLTARVVDGGERGLLGMAFHPRFAQNGEIYLSYTANDGGLVSRVSRFRSGDGGATIAPASEEVLLQVAQPFDNHNGGHIAFGPDGLLYIGLGDGGSGGDPQGNGQNVDTLLGKMLRIDVDVPWTPSRRYGIPADNPFAAGGGRPEIYASGLRNPWRWSFDSATGELWLGDVGQELYEEVDRIELGGNYGWNTREGAHCFNPSTGCATAGLIDPVVEYGHDVGQSVTGGYVYRGTTVPSLAGVLLYGDAVSGRIWGLFFDPRTGLAQGRELLASGASIVSFAQDRQGEVYVVDYAGVLSRLAPADGPPVSVPTLAARLSETGCVEPSDPRRPASGLLPYGVNSPLWSDGAGKERYLALPEGAQIQVRDDGHWDLPIGSVVMKTFVQDGKRVETRLMIRHDDGDWAGYSYEWNDEETDATLLPAGKRKLVGSRSWTYPSRSQCLQCHTRAAGRTLGLETGQLNGDLNYPGAGTGNQLRVLHRIGAVAGLPAELQPPPGATGDVDAILDQLPRLPHPQGAGAVEVRAKAYLHTNCANCHRPGGAAGGLDLRFATALNDMGICDVRPTAGELGIVEPRLLVPGDPARSLVSVRMRALDVRRMPRVGSAEVDERGAALVDDWIRALVGCP